MKKLWLLERMEGWLDRDALADNGQVVSYRALLDSVARWRERLGAERIEPGRVVAFGGDYSEQTVALLLALLERACIAVPLASANESQKADFLVTANVEFLVNRPEVDPAPIEPVASGPKHPLVDKLIGTGHPGLVLFSSGSTGRPKALLHDCERLLQKFHTPRPSRRLLCFLLLDHIGGMNTLFSALANGGTVVTTADRSPSAVCRAIERHRVETLPTSPTFLNLLLLSQEYRRHDLSSLRLITYGTEVMPASTLQRCRQAFPGVRLQQTYGLSELGILRSKSREDGSLWVKVGGEGYETKVVDGILWIRTAASMLGYLNAENPFDAEGWFNTQDAVEQDGEWLRFLGRTTDLINVGGQKVYPTEVESILLDMDNVRDVTVRGERNPIIGQCVVARVNLNGPEPAEEFKARMRRHCHGRLAPYMVPLKVEITADEQYSNRGKRMRSD